MLGIMLAAVTILLYHGYCTWLHCNSSNLVIGMSCYHFAYYHYYFSNQGSTLTHRYRWLQAFEQNTKGLGVLIAIMKLYEQLNYEI